MRRSLSIPLVALALALAGCQRADPMDRPTSDAPSSPDVIEATPLAPDAAPAPTPAPTPAPQPKAAPVEEQTPAETEDPQARIPEGPDMAPQRVPASEVSCREAIGAGASARLVERCIQVSPATHPPCNAANPCDLIQGEIDRSCKMWERDGNPPAACKP